MSSQLEIKALWEQSGNANYEIESIPSGSAVDCMVLKDKLNNRKVRGRIVSKSSEGELYHWVHLQHRSVMPLLDFAFLSADWSVYITPHFDKSLRTTIHEEEFLRCPDYFDLKKTYIEDVLWGLDYLHRKSMCLMNISDDKIMICPDSRRAVIGDLQALTFVSKGCRCTFSVPQFYSPPEMRKPGVRFDPVAAEMWAVGVMALEVFLQHAVRWGMVGYDGDRVMEVVEALDLDDFRSANAGCQLDSADLDEFKSFIGSFLVKSPAARASAQKGATSKFLQSSKMRGHGRFPSLITIDSCSNGTGSLSTVGKSVSSSSHLSPPRTGNEAPPPENPAAPLAFLQRSSTDSEYSTPSSVIDQNSTRTFTVQKKQQPRSSDSSKKRCSCTDVCNRSSPGHRSGEEEAEMVSVAVAADAPPEEESPENEGGKAGLFTMCKKRTSLPLTAEDRKSLPFSRCSSGEFTRKETFFHELKPNHTDIAILRVKPPRKNKKGHRSTRDSFSVEMKSAATVPCPDKRNSAVNSEPLRNPTRDAAWTKPAGFAREERNGYLPAKRLPRVRACENLTENFSPSHPNTISASTNQVDSDGNLKDFSVNHEDIRERLAALYQEQKTKLASESAVAHEDKPDCQCRGCRRTRRRKLRKDRKDQEARELCGKYGQAYDSEDGKADAAADAEKKTRNIHDSIELQWQRQEARKSKKGRPAKDLSGRKNHAFDSDEEKKARNHESMDQHWQTLVRKHKKERQARDLRGQQNQAYESEEERKAVADAEKDGRRESVEQQWQNLVRKHSKARNPLDEAYDSDEGKPADPDKKARNAEVIFDSANLRRRSDASSQSGVTAVVPRRSSYAAAAVVRRDSCAPLTAAAKKHSHSRAVREYPVFVEKGGAGRNNSKDPLLNHQGFDLYLPGPSAQCQKARKKGKPAEEEDLNHMAHVSASLAVCTQNKLPNAPGGPKAILEGLDAQLENPAKKKTFKRAILKCFCIRAPKPRL